MKFGAGGLYSETQAEREAKLGRSRTTHGFSEARNWWRRARRPWARMQRLGRRPAGRSQAALDLTPTATRRLPKLSQPKNFKHDYNSNNVIMSIINS